ncbi:MAG: hypothetical protein AB7H77_10130 [Bdellovibrionales bacterium]
MRHTFKTWAAILTAAVPLAACGTQALSPDTPIFVDGRAPLTPVEQIAANLATGTSNIDGTQYVCTTDAVKARQGGGFRRLALVHPKDGAQKDGISIGGLWNIASLSSNSLAFVHRNPQGETAHAGIITKSDLPSIMGKDGPLAPQDAVTVTAIAQKYISTCIQMSYGVPRGFPGVDHDHTISREQWARALGQMMDTVNDATAIVGAAMLRPPIGDSFMLPSAPAIAPR